MKKFLYIILAVATLSFTVSSCTNDFLKEDMVATITQDYFNTPAGMDALVYGCYDGIRYLTDIYSGLGFFTTVSEESNFATMAASGWSSNGSYASNANGIMGSYNNQIFGTYPVINNCLRAIQGIEEGNLGGSYNDPNYANFMKAQALFIKSYMYYMLNILYGDVYIKESYTTGIGSTFHFPRSTASELYEMMIADLETAYQSLKSYSEYGSVEGRQRVTKGAAAHLLSRLYLERAQAAEWGKYRAADGKPDHATYQTTAHLGLLYKGSVATDLDNAIKYATLVIEDPNYALTADFGDVFRDGDYALEDSSDIILSVSQGQGLNAARYGHRWAYAYSGRYTNTKWGVPSATWLYGQSGAQAGTTEFGYDVYTNKVVDSRFEKTFQVELMAATAGTKTALGDYYDYTNKSNGSVIWQQADADKFLADYYATYDFGGRSYQGTPGQGNRKIGKGDLGVVFLENTKATAIDKDVAQAMPFVVAPRWMKDGNDYYYHAYTANDVFAKTQQAGMEKGHTGGLAYIKKYLDRNRTDITGSYGGRDVPAYRVSETYLIRAEAYARKGQWAQALADINAVRTRAAYKAGETRAYAIANVYDTYMYQQLPAAEKVYPYEVLNSTTDAMTVDQAYVTGADAASAVENYPPVPTWWSQGQDMWNFVNFINNEKLRELQAEFVPFQSQHQAGIQYERMIWHNQMASPADASINGVTKSWDAANNNPGSGQGATAQGHGYYQPHFTFRPFYYTYLEAITDENGVLLSTQGADALKDYQNPGYDY